MSQTLENLDLDLKNASVNAIEAFCEDMSAMLGIEASCTEHKFAQGTLADLQKEYFKKVCAVNEVTAQGMLNGEFRLMFDQAGLFIMAGTIIMLPEKRITEQIRRGTIDDANVLTDAIKEVGNLLVGSWDRVFRDQFSGHKHFKQTDVFIGKPWNDTEENLNMKIDEPCTYVICEMSISQFDTFYCAAVFPDSISTPVEEEDETDDQGQVEGAVEVPADQPETADQAEQTTDNSTDQTDSSQTNLADAAAPNDPEQQIEPQPETQAVSPAGSQHINDAADMDEQSPGKPVSKAIMDLTQKKVDPASQPAFQTIPPQPEVAHGVELNLLAQQIMDTNVVWIDPEETILNTLNTMQQHSTSYLLAGRDGVLEGIVSKSNVLEAVSPFLKPVFSHWRRPQDDASMQIRIKWFMSRPVRTISPDAPLSEIMDKMIRSSVRAFPVMNANGQVEGVLTTFDIMNKLCRVAGSPFQGKTCQAPPFIG